MSLLDIFLSVSGFLLIITTIFYINKSISLFFRFFLIFSGISLIVFTVFPHFLNRIGRFFGLERGADLLVYFSVAFLLYCVLFLFKKTQIILGKNTKIIRELALQNCISNSQFFETTIIIACFNEEKVIRKTITDIFDFNPNLGVIVINDGSTDNSLGILLNLQKKFPNIIILQHLDNLGQGAALETGFEYIRRQKIITNFVVTFDADGQMDISNLPSMLDILDKNPSVEVVLGSRFLKNKNKIPLARKIILKLGIIFTFLFSKILLSDTHNGYRVFRFSAILKIKISMDGMGHASEIIDIISRQKINFVEAPVDIIYTDYSIKKGQKGLNSIKIALKILFQKFF